MAIDVVMPRLGWTMETGKIAEWLKREGDAVRAGEVLFTVESDKALQEVEALESGILHIPSWSAPPGADVPVGAVLAYLVQPGEPLPSAPGGGDASGPSAAPGGAAPVTATGGAPATPRVDVTPTPAFESADTGEAVTSPRAAGTTPPISPRALRVAAELGVDWTTAVGSGRTGRVVERDVRALAAPSAHPVEPTLAPSTPGTPARVTPLARRAAESAGIDVGDLSARMPGRRITRSDVAGAANGASDLASGGPDGHGARRQPIDGARRIVADRMAHSARTAAPVTLTTDADATELVRVREHIKASMAEGSAPVPSYNDLLARLVALALLQHPDMNSSLSDDAIVRHDAVHMGIAVDTDRGLLVPVVRDAHTKSVQQIAAESARLIAQARAARAGPDDLRGGTFTITNLGAYAIDAFTPIINLPECAILGVGRIVARPVVVDEETEEIAVRKMVALSLTFDHRLVDGAPAARFLRHIARWIEQPYGWLTM